MPQSKRPRNKAIPPTKEPQILADLHSRPQLALMINSIEHPDDIIESGVVEVDDADMKVGLVCSDMTPLIFPGVYHVEVGVIEMKNWDEARQAVSMVSQYSREFPTFKFVLPFFPDEEKPGHPSPAMGFMPCENDAEVAYVLSGAPSLEIGRFYVVISQGQLVAASDREYPADSVNANFSAMVFQTHMQ